MRSLQNGRTKNGQAMITEQEIQKLCSVIVNAEDQAQFNASVVSLMSALREHALQSANRNLQMLLQLVEKHRKALTLQFHS